MNTREGMVYMMIDNKSIEIEYRFICELSAIEEYNLFYEFLLKNCNKDKEDIIKKELKYLDETYVNLVEDIIIKKSDEINKLKLFRLCCKSRDKLKRYLDKNKKEYYEYDSIKNEDKEYRYYNNMASWYSLKMDITDRVINNLTKKTTESFVKKSPEQGSRYIFEKVENKNEILISNYI
jgi:hypothetical protein